MKNFIIIILFLLCTSFSTRGNDVRDFHIRIVSIEEVQKFETKFPQIIKDKYVYIAYLGKYCKERDYYLLLKYRG